MPPTLQQEFSIQKYHLTALIETGKIDEALIIVRNVLEEKDRVKDDINTKRSMMNMVVKVLVKIVKNHTQNMADTVNDVLLLLQDREYFNNFDILKVCIMLCIEMKMNDHIHALVFNEKLVRWADSQDSSSYLTKLLWNHGLKTEDDLNKFSFLYLAGVLTSDKETKNLCQFASVPSTFQVMRSSQNQSVRDDLMFRLFIIFNSLDQVSLSGDQQRLMSLFRLQLSQVSGNNYPCNIKNIIGSLNKDMIGLLAASVICLKDVECLNDDLVDSYARMFESVINLEEDSNNVQNLALGLIEILSRAATSPTLATADVIQVVQSVQWSDTDLMLEAMKISWNSWAKVSSEPGEYSLFMG